MAPCLCMYMPATTLSVPLHARASIVRAHAHISHHYFIFDLYTVSKIFISEHICNTSFIDITVKFLKQNF